MALKANINVFILAFELGVNYCLVHCFVETVFPTTNITAGQQNGRTGCAQEHPCNLHFLVAIFTVIVSLA
jgi:hypothetical protein